MQQSFIIFKGNNLFWPFLLLDLLHSTLVPHTTLSVSETIFSLLVSSPGHLVLPTDSIVRDL